MSDELTTAVTRFITAPVPPAEAVQALAQHLGVPPALASLLVQRGFGDVESAKQFLRPAIDGLADPESLAGLSDAADLVADTVRSGRTILIHGDYDVDGQCATALLTRALRAAGASVVPMVPHRMKHGYDFGPAGLAAALEHDAALVLTCDCGILAHATVAEAKARGLRVVVTDHHLPGATLPPADAVVDPQRADDTSGLGMLCGTGIAFKLVQALVPRLGLPANLPLHLLDFVALATVADVVPLVGENRVLVRHGLKVLQQSRWPGLRALITEAGLEGKEIKAGSLGFILGPRLNAVGRIADANDGLRLLLTDDPDEARALAAHCEQCNTERQSLDRRILDEAIAQVEQMEQLPHALVLAGDNWHPGVVGIVASRIVERTGRPAFLLALEGETGRGSGRSIQAFDLHAALQQCDDLLERWGGHHMAAGLTIRREHLEAFRTRFAAVAAARLTADDLGPEQRVDLEVALDELTPEFERLCRHLEPCGMGNPGPVFAVRGVRVLRRTVVGAGHLKCRLGDARTSIEAIGWSMADRYPWLGGEPVDAAFRLELNTFRNANTLQAKLVSLRPADA
jgi:single-stranded-DNA-specific exonuclease